MKKVTLLLAIGLIGVSPFTSGLMAGDDDHVPPGLKKKGGVPPGLQKKGGLPPGQAKKQAKYGQPPEVAPAPSAPSAPTTVNTPSVPSAPTPPAAPPTAKVPDAPAPPAPPKVPAPETTKPAQPVSKVVAERRAKLDRHVADLDAMGKTPEVRERMMVRLYRRLDVPLSTMEAELKAHPNMGIGGLVAGHIIARRSKQPAEKIFAAHDGGKSWGEIAGAHKVELTELNASMADAKEAARAAERESAKR